MTTKVHTFGVTGMTCGSCVAYLESKLSPLENVEEVSVSLMLNRAEIRGGDKDLIFDTITLSGFTPTYISSTDSSTAIKTPKKTLQQSHKKTHPASIQIEFDQSSQDDVSDISDIHTPSSPNNALTQQDSATSTHLGSFNQLDLNSSPTNNEHNISNSLKFDDLDSVLQNQSSKGELNDPNDLLRELDLNPYNQNGENQDIGLLLDDLDAFLSTMISSIPTTPAAQDQSKGLSSGDQNTASNASTILTPASSLTSVLDPNCETNEYDQHNEHTVQKEQKNGHKEQNELATQDVSGLVFNILNDSMDTSFNSPTTPLKTNCCSKPADNNQNKGDEDKNENTPNKLLGIEQIEQINAHEVISSSSVQNSCCSTKSTAGITPTSAFTAVTITSSPIDITVTDITPPAIDFTATPTNLQNSPRAANFTLDNIISSTPLTSNQTANREHELNISTNKPRIHIDTHDSYFATSSPSSLQPNINLNSSHSLQTPSQSPQSSQTQTLDLFESMLSSPPSSPTFSTSPASPTSSQNNTSSLPNDNVLIHTFGVKGMTCGSCVKYLTSKLETIETIQNISISLPLERAEIQGSTQDTIFNMIKTSGFIPTYISTSTNGITSYLVSTEELTPKNIQNDPKKDTSDTNMAHLFDVDIFDGSTDKITPNQNQTNASAHNAQKVPTSQNTSNNNNIPNTNHDMYTLNIQSDTMNENDEDGFKFEFTDPQAKLDYVADFDPLQVIEKIPQNDQNININNVTVPLVEMKTPPIVNHAHSQLINKATSQPTHIFGVSGMTCGSCVAYLESKLTPLESVQEVSVSLMLNRAEIRGGDKDVLFDMIKASGFIPTFISTSIGDQKTAKKSLGLKLPTKPSNVKIDQPSYSPEASSSDTTNTSYSNDLSNSSTQPRVSRSQQRAAKQASETSEMHIQNSTQPNLSLSSSHRDPIYSQSTPSNTSQNTTQPINPTHPTPKIKKNVAETPSEKLAKQAYEWYLRLQVALCFAVPIFTIAMILPLNDVANRILMTQVINSATVTGILLFALSTPVQFGVGRVFLQNAIQALRNGHANMSVLIAIGSLSAYLYSFAALLNNALTFDDNPYIHSNMREHFFETSSTLITVVIFGQYLEHVAKGHTSSALSKLMTLQPSTATSVQITPNGIELISHLGLRTNQQDDELFQQIQSYLPFFSYHYTSSSSSSSLQSNQSHSTNATDSHLIQTKSNIIIGTNSIGLTASQKYTFDHILSESGLHISQLDDTRDVNQYILSNTTQTIDTEDLAEGIFVKIIRGSKVPADCMLVLGTCYIDDSVVTGESIHRKKIPGSTLIGGTLVTEGVCIAVVLRTGEDTTLSQIVTLVEQAQISKAPISAFADQISLYFVPTIIGLSLLTLVVWFFLGSVFHITYRVFNEKTQVYDSMGIFTHAVIRAVAVVVIACPCALGLATPTAVMVATGVGAKNGVLIKGGAALEAAANLDTIVFDKTGTITKGKPQVVCSMVFSPQYMQNWSTGNKRGTGQTLLNSLTSCLPHHLLFVSDEVQIQHYSSIIEKSIESSIKSAAQNSIPTTTNGIASSRPQLLNFGQIDISPMNTSTPEYSLFNKNNDNDSNSNTQNAHSTLLSQNSATSHFSSELNQTLRLLFTTLANAESNSEHFIGQCVLKYLKQQTLNLSQNHFQNHANAPFVSLPEQNIIMHAVVNQTGRGVKAHVSFPQSYYATSTNQSNIQTKPVPIVIGNANWLIDNQVHIPPIIASIAIQLESQGLTVIFSSLENVLLGLFAIGDDIKPEAFEVMRYLQEVMNYQIYILTGDNARNAKFLAHRLNIPQKQVYAHLSPTQKLNIVKQLQQNGQVINHHAPLPPDDIQIRQQQLEYFKEKHRFKIKDVVPYLPIIGSIVKFIENNDKDDLKQYGNLNGDNTTNTNPRSVCFVGDGINDSPALAQAHVGIAIGAGTDVAIESADMVLVRNDLIDLLTALVLSRQTLHRIKSNFGWSLLYNVLSIPIAAGVFFPITTMILPPEVAALAMGCSSISVVVSSLMLKLFRAPLASLSGNDGSDLDSEKRHPGDHQTITIGHASKHTQFTSSADNGNNLATSTISRSIIKTKSKNGNKYNQFHDGE